MVGTAEIARANGKKGGRPFGNAHRLSIKRANELAASGRTPLDVMIENMHFWYDAAQSASARVMKMLAEADAAEDMAELSKALRSMLDYRQKSQQCAVEAAPYVHAKLASINIKKDEDDTPPEIAMTLPAPAGAEDRSYRDGPTINIVADERVPA